MNSALANKFAIPFLLGALIFCFLMRFEFVEAEGNLRSGHQFWLDSQRKAWAREDAERSLATSQKALEVEKTHRLELLAAFGGPIEAVVKDPTLDIREMLRQTAAACAPSNTAVSVTVDRFTEFEVVLELNQPLSFPQLAVISQCLLAHGTPYVHGLRFLYGSKLLAELDEPDIESLRDWSAAPADAVEHLLLVAAARTQPEPVAAASDDSTGQSAQTKDLSRDQIKIADAQSAFKQLFNDHFSNVTNIMNLIAQATRLDSSRGDSDLRSQIARLDQLRSDVLAERKFFLNQSAELDRLLRKQGLDPLVVAILVREGNDRIQLQLPFIEKFFDALSVSLQESRDFLAAMESHWGEWDTDAKLVHFKSQAAADAYSSGSAGTQLGIGSMNQAIQSWLQFSNSR